MNSLNSCHNYYDAPHFPDDHPLKQKLEVDEPVNVDALMQELNASNPVIDQTALLMKMNQLRELFNNANQ